jgi:hypothetical protein
LEDEVHSGLSVTAMVVGLVLGIAAIQALIWGVIITWLRRRTRAANAHLLAAIETETVICPPERGSYRGATAPGYPVVKNNGVVALTRRRLIFLTTTGKTIEIPLEAITGLRESNVFKASVRGGRTHLVVRVSTGEIGFFVSDTDTWINAIRIASRQWGRLLPGRQ